MKTFLLVWGCLLAEVTASGSDLTFDPDMFSSGNRESGTWLVGSSTHDDSGQDGVTRRTMPDEAPLPGICQSFLDNGCYDDVWKYDDDDDDDDDNGYRRETNDYNVTTSCNGSYDARGYVFNSDITKWYFWLKENEEIEIDVVQDGTCSPRFRVYLGEQATIDGCTHNYRRVIKSIPKSGIYSIAITAYSDAGDGYDFDYKIRFTSPDKDNNGIGDACDRSLDKIRYEGTLDACDGVSSFGTFDTTKALSTHYWKIWLTAASKVMVRLKRLDCDLDIKMSLSSMTGEFFSELSPVASSVAIDKPGRCPDSVGKDVKLVLKNRCVHGITDCQDGYYTLQVLNSGVIDGGGAGKGRYKITVYSQDRDKDGIPDTCDLCPLTDSYSNSTIKVLSCDTGAKDVVASNGCSVNDEMLHLLQSCANEPPLNQCMREKLTDFVTRGVILPNTRYAIMKCVKKTPPDNVRKVCGNSLLLVEGSGMAYVVAPSTRKRRLYGRLPPYDTTRYPYQTYPYYAPRPYPYTSVEYVDANDVLWGGFTQIMFPRRGFPAQCQSLTSANPSSSDLTDTAVVDGDLYSLVPRPQQLKMLNTTGCGRHEIVSQIKQNRLRSIAYDREDSQMWALVNSTELLVKMDMNSFQVDTTSAMDIVDIIGKKKLTKFYDITFGPDGELYGLMKNNASPKRKSIVSINTATGIARRVVDGGGVHPSGAGLTCFTLRGS